MKVGVEQHSQHLYDIELPSIDLENGGEFYIGRSDDCHIQLEDNQISRTHAVFFYKNGKLKIKKLSEFGSLQVAGNEISEIDLKNGAQIAIADFKITVNDLPQGLDQIESSATESPPLEDLETPGTPTEMTMPGKEAPGMDNTAQMQDLFENTLDESSSETIEEGASDDDEFDDTPLDANSDDEFSDGENSESDEFSESNDENSDDAFAQSDEEDGFGDDSGSDEGGFGDSGFGDDGDSGFGDDGDSGFGDDDGGFGDDGGDVGESTQVFQSFAKYTLTIDGQFAPFDKYIIEDKEIFIGRDEEKCQIVLNDSEVSGAHAVIRKTLINCFIEDLNSSNGTIYNGERINKAELQNGDSFQIGSTYFSVRIDSDLIQQESDMLMPVEEDQEIEIEEVVEEEVDYDDLDGEGGDFSDEFGGEVVHEKGLKAIMADPKKKKIVIIGGVVLLLLMLLDGGEEKKAPKKTVKKAATKKVAPDANKNKGPNLSKADLDKLEANYKLAIAKYEAGEYYEAQTYLDTIRSIYPDYKDTKQIYLLVKEGYEQLERLKKEEEEEKQRKLRQKQIKELVDKATEAVKKREVQVAESIFSQILQKDPENLEVPQLKIEIDAYKQAEEKKRLEAQRKKALRQSMVDKLAPGKALYLKEDWYKALDALQKFVKEEGMDEDLIKEATDMIKTSKRKLSAIINPLLAKARSAREGQDLKRAYETYADVLKYDPLNTEALNSREEIFESLQNRSMKIYREALISESLSLFDEAREKFQEVQQISPVNSEYYNKATAKLKNYLE